jgi:hypothetical protein
VTQIFSLGLTVPASKWPTPVAYLADREAGDRTSPTGRQRSTASRDPHVVDRVGVVPSQNFWLERNKALSGDAVIRFQRVITILEKVRFPENVTILGLLTKSRRHMVLC